MESLDVIMNEGDMTAETSGKKLIDYERTVNSDLHTQAESNNCDDLTTSNVSISQSVDESRATSVAMDVDSSSDKENREILITGKNTVLVDDDDDDDDDYNNVDILSNKRTTNRLRAIIDSDSDDELIISKRGNKSPSTEDITEVREQINDSKIKKRFKITSDSESEDEEEKIDENVKDASKELGEVRENNKSMKFSTLIDSESEDESYNNRMNANYQKFEEEKVDISLNKNSKKEKPEKQKKKTGSKRAAKDEAMKQIHSETQRLFREAAVSLPYHKPKQRTLEEFLNRKKITLNLPKAATTVAKLKMSTAIVSKVLEEKVKEAELFYKSDSEDENSIDNQLNDSQDKLTTSKELKETDTNIIQNKLNEEPQQDARSAASRRLFDGDSCDSTEVTSIVKESMKINGTDEQNFSEKIEPFIFSTDSSIIATNIQTNVEEKKDEPDVDKIENDCNKDLPQVVESSITVSSLDHDELSEKNELSSVKMMTDEEVKELLDEESEPDEASPPQASENILALEQADKKDDTEESEKQLSELDGHVLALPFPNSDSPEKKIETSELSSVTTKKNLFPNVSNLKPKLRGIPGMVIDLTNEIKPNKEAINSLMDRFLMKHSKVNKHVETDHEVTILQTETTPDGLKIVKDVVPYKINANEAEDSELNKPGAKLVRLKEDLMKKMTNRRNQEWKQKEQEVMDEDNEDEENEYEEKNYKLKDDDDEDVAESEPEEDDIPIKETKRKHCGFGDEEAEVSEDDIELSDDENEEDDEEKENDEDDEEDKEEEDDDDEEEEEEKTDDDDDEEENKNNKPKKFSRIVAVNDNDSNSADDAILEPKQTLERTNTDVDIFADDDDDDDLPSYQVPRSDAETNSPVYKTPSTPNPFSFLSNKSSNVESPAKSIPSQMNSWDIGSTQIQTNDSQKKLFQTQDKVVTDEELMALCSGSFTNSNNTQLNNVTPRLTGLIDSKKDKPISESQLINMCSGKFETQASFDDNTDETSQDFKLTFDENSQSHFENNLKGKMEEKKSKTVPWKSLNIASSSEDENIEESLEKKIKNKVLKKKKKIKQLVLSDDEEDEDQVNSNDEEEDEDIESEDEEKFVDYDSEENEVVVVPKKDIKKVAANFLEAEAELSESEWGSEDEDEKGLDKLELEAGDDEEIDEDQMRDQIGKMHARQVLDDDQRDVRMLQELLFEDGDLHTDGSGRERKFKWKNINKFTEENLLRPLNEIDDDNDIDPNTIADEMKFRKYRLEREKFLEEKSKSIDDYLLGDDMISGGQLLKLGMKVLKKKGNNFEQKSVEITSSKTIIPRTVSELMGTPVGEKSKLLHNAMKKGSFLARGDEALARLAVVIKQTDNVVLAPKHSKNFLFTHQSPSIDNAEVDEKQEEIHDEEIVDNKTRKRKSMTGGTPRSMKKAKTEGNRLGKKLF